MFLNNDVIGEVMGFLADDEYTLCVAIFGLYKDNNILKKYSGLGVPSDKLSDIIRVSEKDSELRRWISSYKILVPSEHIIKDFHLLIDGFAKRNISSIGWYNPMILYLQEIGHYRRIYNLGKYENTLYELAETVLTKNDDGITKILKHSSVTSIPYKAVVSVLTYEEYIKYASNIYIKNIILERNRKDLVTRLLSDKDALSSEYLNKYAYECADNLCLWDVICESSNTILGGRRQWKNINLCPIIARAMFWTRKYKDLYRLTTDLGIDILEPNMRCIFIYKLLSNDLGIKLDYDDLGYPPEIPKYTQLYFLYKKGGYNRCIRLAIAIKKYTKSERYMRNHIISKCYRRMHNIKMYEQYRDMRYTDIL